MLPAEVIEQARDEMLDWRGSGMSVMEMSHRGKEFMEIASTAEADLRELLAIPSNYKVLFLQGGASSQFAMVPLNLMGRTGSADYSNTGAWSKKAISEGKRFGTVNVCATSEADGFNSVPDYSDWNLSKDAAYVHVTPNETIGGVAFEGLPDTGDKPIVADMSSTILSQPINVADYGILYAGAQKNVGPAGLTIVIIRDDLIGGASGECPAMFNYATHADNESMYNPADLQLVPGRAGVPVAEKQRWPERHGRDQPAQGRQAVRGHRWQRFLQQPGSGQESLDHEHPLRTQGRRAGCRFLGRGQEAGPDHPQGAPLGRRHARQHLQRHARGRHRRAGRFHGRLRRASRLRGAR
jgi:hypothetical protein